MTFSWPCHSGNLIPPGSGYYGHSGIVESARDLYQQIDGNPEKKGINSSFFLFFNQTISANHTKSITLHYHLLPYFGTIKHLCGHFSRHIINNFPCKQIKLGNRFL